MRFSWGAFYAILYLYRCAASVTAELFIARITPIPDSDTYQSLDLTNVSSLIGTFDPFGGWMLRGTATAMTRAIGAFFNTLGGDNEILINIGFQTIAFVGIVMLLRSVHGSTRKFLAVLVMLPSFTIWSSIAAKEPIVVFLVCVLAKYVIDIHHNRSNFGLLDLFSLALLYVYKPHFIPAIVFVIVVSKIASNLRWRATFAFASGAVTLLLLFLLRDVVDSMALFFIDWIYEGVGSSRSERLLVEHYDVFLKAPIGMWLAFTGPTWAEASGNALQMAAFLESVVILALLGTYILRRLPGTPAYGFAVGAFTLFWILFATYPLGLSNPGTAIRFRTDYILIVYVALVVLTSRTMFVGWRRGRPPTTGRRRARPARPQVS